MICTGEIIVQFLSAEEMNYNLHVRVLMKVTEWKWKFLWSIIKTNVMLVYIDIQSGEFETGYSGNLVYRR